MLAALLLPCGPPSHRTAFRTKHPCDSESRSCNTSGNLDLPVCHFCVEILLRGKEVLMFSEKPQTRAVLLVTASRDSFICLGEVCVVLHPSCGQRCCCVCVTQSFPTSTRCCSATNLFSLLHHSQKLGTFAMSPASFCTGLQATLNNHPQKTEKVSSWTFAVCSFSAHIFASNHDLSLRR